MVQVGLGFWQQRLHRFYQAETDDTAGCRTLGRIKPGAGETILHRAANVDLTVDERAVAVEKSESVHAGKLKGGGGASDDATARLPFASRASATANRAASGLFWPSFLVPRQATISMV